MVDLSGDSICTLARAVGLDPTARSLSVAVRRATGVGRPRCSSDGEAVFHPRRKKRGNNVTEAQLVAAAKGGDRAAFDVLCQTHTEQLFRTVSRITCNHHDAQDAVQDSLLSIFLHLKAFDGRSRLSTWVTRIAINSALMTLRRKHRCREVSLDSEDGMICKGAFTTEDPEKQFAERERRKLIRDEVAHLRATIRRPLELRQLEDYSYKETAKMIGISIPAVKGRLFHARKALRKSNVLRNQFGKENTVSPATEEAGVKKPSGVAISTPACHAAMLQEPQKVAYLITQAAKKVRRPRPITRRDSKHWIKEKSNVD